MKVTAPSNPDFEKAAITKAQALIEQMHENLLGIEVLNHIHAQLEAEIADYKLAIETVAKLRSEMWMKQGEEFEKTQGLIEVGKEV